MSYSRHSWQDDAACLESDVEEYFDKYEDDSGEFNIRHKVDSGCRKCPVMRTCFAYGKFFELTGVWGGIYMNNGSIDHAINEHKSPEDWAQTYAALTS